MSVSSGNSQRRIAWWSPWPPSRSGVAEYSLALIEYLRHHAQISVFVENAAASYSKVPFSDVQILPARAFASEHGRKPFDIAIFQLGNQAGHAYMADALFGAPCPRIAVFHDGSLYHLYQGISEWRLLREIANEEGWLAAWRAWRRLRLPGSDSYNHPLLRRACLSCNLLVAHSSFLAKRLQKVAPHTRLVVVPYGSTPFLDDGGMLQREARRALGLPQDAVIFGVFGHVTAAKRVERVIEAFAASDLPQSWLYVAGEVTPLAPEAVRQWAEDSARCARHRIRFEAAYRTPLYVLLAMQAVDVGVNLRFPTTGETSAVVSDLLSMGKPVIVSNVGAFCELPDACAIKISIGDQEITDLTVAMHMLATQPERRAHMATAARAYSAQRTWEIVARSYLEMVDTMCAS